MQIHQITSLFHNDILICALVAWLIAQGLKVPIYWWVEKELNWQRFFGSGGMPSSHSAFVVAVGLMVGIRVGFESPEFAICFVLAAIVMYDAAGVRRETGTQATIINQIIRDVLINGKPISDEELKELVGHTPLEVLAGAIVGVLTTLAFIIR